MGPEGAGVAALGPAQVPSIAGSTAPGRGSDPAGRRAAPAGHALPGPPVLIWFGVVPGPHILSCPSRCLGLEPAFPAPFGDRASLPRRDAFPRDGVAPGGKSSGQPPNSANWGQRPGTPCLSRSKRQLCHLRPFCTPTVSGFQTWRQSPLLSTTRPPRLLHPSGAGPEHGSRSPGGGGGGRSAHTQQVPLFAWHRLGVGHYPKRPRAGGLGQEMAPCPASRPRVPSSEAGRCHSQVGRQVGPVIAAGRWGR